MHPRFEEADKLSKEVIGAAIEVHRCMGCGLLESIYEKCLFRELQLQNIAAVNQKQVFITYKGARFEEILKFDLLIEDCLLVELKAVQEVSQFHKAQLMTYMKLLNIPVGLLINFHELKLVDGLSRMILPGANIGTRKTHSTTHT
ncbi:MAG: GxxExxY protein [Pirellulales bacterium]|nr:GxxExxY protein [Pirellulales bacterium]